MAILLALAAALSNAVGSILQRLGIEEALGVHRGGLAGIVRRPMWLAGFATMGAAFGFQAAALHVGSVGVVQPLLLAELPFVVVLLIVWFGQRHARLDVLAVVGAAAGLAGVLASFAPSDGDGAPSAARWAGIVGLVVLLQGAATSVGWRRSPARRALLLGIGAALGFALVAVLTKVAAGAAVLGIGHLLTCWQAFALCAVGGASLALMQEAFSSGPFSMSQGALILVNPVASIALGAATFGCHVRHTAAAIACGTMSAAVLTGSVLTVLRSPLVREAHDDGATHRLLGAGRLARWRAAKR